MEVKNSKIEEEQEKLVSMKRTVDFIEKNAGLFNEYFYDIMDINYGRVTKPIMVSQALADYILENDIYAYGALGEFAVLHKNEKVNEANTYGLILKLINEEEKNKGLSGITQEEIQKDGDLARKKIQYDKHREMYRKYLFLCEDRRDLNNSICIDNIEKPKSK